MAELKLQGKCPSCGSPSPHKHPAVQLGGEVQLCADKYHLTEIKQQRERRLPEGWTYKGEAK